MLQSDSNVPAGSITGRAELLSAIARLIDEVAHLALRVEFLLAKTNAVNLPLAHDNPTEQNIFKPEVIETCDAETVNTSEVGNTPLSPQQNNWTYSASIAEMDLGDHLDNNIGALFTPKNARSGYGLAGRILELQDRLGGFIKPALSKQPKPKV